MINAPDPNPFEAPRAELDGDRLTEGQPARPAPLWRRLLAALLDAFFFAGLSFMFFSCLAFPLSFLVPVKFDKEGDRIMRAWIALVLGFAFFGLPFLYSALMESSTLGATMGKVTLGLRVVDLKGRRITFTRSAGRTLLKPVTVGSIVGLVPALFRPDHRALHDLLAETVVVAVAPDRRKVVVEQSSNPG